MGIMGIKVIKSKKSADERTIVATAKRDFGYLSRRVRAANSLKEMTPALRALALSLAATNPDVCDKILKFQEEHELAGI